jgi:hypothetical protein
MGMSMGFSLSLSLLPAILATGLLAFTLVGLPLSFPPNAPAFAGRTTARAFPAVCAQQWAASVACLLCNS